MTQPPWDPPPGSPPPPPPPYGGGYPPAEDTTLSVLVHLSWFAFALLGPLVLFLVVKDDPTKQMTRHHAVESLNFHLSMGLYAVISIPLLFVIVGFFTLIAVIVGGTVLAIVAAVAAGRREAYRYPLTIRLVH